MASQSQEFPVSTIDERYTTDKLHFDPSHDQLYVNSRPATTDLKGQPATKFASGAVRGTDASGTRYDLISPHILTALAEAYAEGAGKYGDDNWLKGIPSKDLMNHALRHLVLWQTGDDTEDHLGHAMWNIGAIIHFQKTKPELVVRQYAAKENTARPGRL